MGGVGSGAARSPVAHNRLPNSNGQGKPSYPTGRSDGRIERLNDMSIFHERDITTITIVSQLRENITVVITIADRLKEARTSAGLTQPELAKRANVSQSTIGNIESGLRKRPRELLAIAAALGVAPLWLETGSGPKASTVQNIEPAPASRGKVPLISWVRAGEWCEASDPFLPGDAEKWFDCPVAHSDGSFALRVRGDSMTASHGNTRTYPEGCIIFVDPERKSPVNGDRIVACLETTHEVTFKVYKNEDGRQWLQPLNPSHEPIREPFKVLGTVLGKWEDG